MKILVLSNVYPPYFIGGYELACHEIVERLKAVGHHVAVLTSRYGLPTQCGKRDAECLKCGGRSVECGMSRMRDAECGMRNAGDASTPHSALRTPHSEHTAIRTPPSDRVYRLFYYHTVPSFPLTSMRQRAVVEYRDVRALRRVLAEERPDLIHVWNMGGLTRSLLAVAHASPAPVVYEIFDGWLSQPPDVHEWADFWQRPSHHPIKRYLKGPAKYLAGRLLPIDLPLLDLRHIVFKSHYLKRAALAFGMPVEHAPVIYHGVNRAVFHPDEGRPSLSDCRVLYVGQVAPHKGVHTLIEAFAILARDPAQAGTSLTVAGGSIHPDYVAKLHAAVRAHGLGERIRFQEMVPRYELPHVYHAHDVLVFPSTWQEPFGLTQVEAMACGLPVIGTGTGGSDEILTDETALRFPPGDAAALADCIAQLAADPDRRRRMGATAARHVARHFDIDETARRTEAYLQDALAARGMGRVEWRIPFAADNPSRNA